MTALEMKFPEWLVAAPCASIDPGLFFPEQGAPSKPAKKICASCPLAKKCLAWAVSEGIIHGIYGGLTGVERRSLRQCRRCDSLAAPSSKYCDGECREIARAENHLTYKQRAGRKRRAVA